MSKQNLALGEQDLRAHQAYLTHKEEVYRRDLETGKIERSNLQANIRFLSDTEILREEHRILEVGCGAGSMTAYLASQRYNVVGTDVSEALLEYARQKHPGCTFLTMYGESLEFDNEAFDVVLSFDVLEHIPDVHKHVEEVGRVLVPGGYYLLQTPNKWTNIVYSVLRDKSLTEWRKAHPSLQTRRSLRILMAKHGFTVRFARMTVFNEFTRNKLKPPFNRINLDKIPVHTNHYVIAQKTRAPQ